MLFLVATAVLPAIGATDPPGVILAPAAADLVDVGGVGGASGPSFAAAVSGDGRVIVGQLERDGVILPMVWRVSFGGDGDGFDDDGVVDAPFSLGRNPGAPAPESSVPYTFLTGVNENGRVAVGVAAVADPAAPDDTARSVQAGFVYDVDAGDAVVLADAPGGSVLGNVEDVSADGRVVVGASSDDRDDFVAVRWDDLQLTVIGTLNSARPRSDARAVSADGRVVVGGSPAGAGAAPPSHSFVQRDGGALRDLSDLDGGADFCAVADVSADGSVIVGSSSSARSGENALEAFLWVDTGESGDGVVLEALGALGDVAAGVPFASDALAVSSPAGGRDVVVVGRSVVDVDENEHATVWTRKDGLRDLNVVLADAGVDLGDVVLAQATGISDDGRVIVGNALTPAGVRAFAVRIPSVDGAGDNADNNDDGGLGPVTPPNDGVGCAGCAGAGAGAGKSGDASMLLAVAGLVLSARRRRQRRSI